MTAEELGQMIWNVKELLRNVYDNKDVEDVILPFTLLRRLDCVLVGSSFLLPPSSFFLRYPPGSLHNRLIRFLSTFFSFPASLFDLPKKGFRGCVRK